MRLLDLHLKAFGPFTDRRLDLSRGSPGLHVVYGPNEAGKSSALRALKALLYGFEERSTDAFVHDNERLRVGGCLQDAAGRRLEIVRRKGRKGTLLTPGEERPLDDAILAPFLPVSAEVFSSVFGIDHRELVEGGQQILAQKGDVGQALFAAALGSQRYQSVLQALEAEAGELFKPRASTPLVNRALSDLAEARRQTRELSLAAKDWSEHARALEEAEARLATLRVELTGWYAEQGAVRRRQRTLPHVFARRALLAELHDMGDAVELAADFGVRRHDLAARLVAAQEALVDDRAACERLAAEALALMPPARLLEHAAAVGDVVQRLGSYVKSRADRPGQDGKRAQARNEARALLKELRPGLALDDVVALRPAIRAGRRAIGELATRHQVVEAGERKARKSLQELQDRIAARRGELATAPEPREVGPLQRALAAARRSGDLDLRLRELQREVDLLETQCRADRAALAPWPVDEANVLGLPVPVDETVDRFEVRFREVEDQRRRFADARARLLRERATEELALDAMRLAGALPTEHDLTAVRLRRRAGWSLVRRAWQDAADVTEEAMEFDPDRALPEAYEAAVLDADEVADRLRREAGRVAQQAQHLARTEQVSGQLRELDGAEAGLVVQEGALLDEWSRQWAPCAIAPLPPREMRAWLARVQVFRRRVEQAMEARGRVEAVRETIARHTGVVGDLLREAGGAPSAGGGALGPLLEQAEAVVEASEKAKAQREDLARLVGELPRVAAEAERAAEDLSTWREEWRTALVPLALEPDQRPTVVLSMLDTYDALFARMKEEDDLGRRVWGIDQDIKEYEDEVRTLVGEVAPELADPDVRRAVTALEHALRKATADQARRAALEEQIRELEVRIALAGSRREQAEEGLRALCVEAGKARPEELEEALGRSLAVRERQDSVRAVERAIREAGDGLDLEALVQEAEATDAAELPVRLEAVEHEIRRREDERQRLHEAKGAEESELRRMTGASAAADAALVAQEILAALRGHVERFLRVRTAALLLKREIERYREANQSPLLVRAGELLARLTLGSFRSVRTEVGDDDAPLLVGVRPGGRTVRVEGMSSGSRDQLYLALRLAALEHYLAGGAAVPFVVDDLLINFDDVRARATLDVLAAFASRTQVLLFTHHERIRAMAEELGEARGVFVLDL